MALVTSITSNYFVAGNSNLAKIKIFPVQTTQETTADKILPLPLTFKIAITSYSPASVVSS